MIEYAIMEVSSGYVSSHSRHVDPKPRQVDELRRTCARYNAGLREKGERVARLIEKEALALTIDEFREIREWRVGAYDSDRPDKSKRYVVVRREITAWEQES